MNVIDDENLILIKSIHHATENCIRNALLFDATPVEQGDYLIMAQRNFALMCVLHWSTIFGARTETAHYTKLFSSSNTTHVSNGTLDCNVVKQHFQSAITMNDTEYAEFHKQCHTVRNSFISHRDLEQDSILPDLDLNMLQCFALRDKVAELIEQSVKNGDPEIDALKLLEYYQDRGSQHGMLNNINTSILEFNGLKKVELSKEVYKKYKPMLIDKT